MHHGVSCRVGGQIEGGAMLWAFGAERGVRQWGQVEGVPWGELSGKWANQGVPYHGAFVQVKGAGGGCQVRVERAPW